MTPRTPHRLAGVAAAAAAVLALPAPAWATQTHGAPEGLYVHLLGHMLFLAAMVYYALSLVRSGESGYPGGTWMLAAVLLLALWSVDTALVHIYQEADPGVRTRGTVRGLAAFLEVRAWPDRLFYVARLDHLLMVPALAALAAGIRGMLRREEEQG